MNRVLSVTKGYGEDSGWAKIVVEENGRERNIKRRYRENASRRGRFAGKVTFNVWDNVYSFRWTPGWSEISEENITYEGRYVDIHGGKKRKVSESIRETAEDKGIKIPEVKKEEKEIDYDGAIYHEKYEQIRICVENDIPVFLVGPAGSGKNFTLEQIAESLGLDFHFTNSVQQEYKLTGFIDAGGEYHETEFYKAFTNGGLFFLDEMDASIPEVLVLLNAAIANRYFEFPNGKVDAHKDFRVVAAGNTMGSGADEQYNGRLVLDQATLDRFAIIEFDYDLRIEMHITRGNTDLVNFVRQLRKEAEDKGIRATFSYRCLEMVVKLEAAGAELYDIIKIAIVRGLDSDTVKTLRPTGYTKYHTALTAVQRAA